MQTKQNDMWTVSDEPTSNLAAFADPSSSIVVLDEASLEGVNGAGIFGAIKKAVKAVKDFVEDILDGPDDC